MLQLRPAFLLIIANGTLVNSVPVPAQFTKMVGGTVSEVKTSRAAGYKLFV